MTWMQICVMVANNINSDTFQKLLSLSVCLLGGVGNTVEYQLLGVQTLRTDRPALESPSCHTSFVTVDKSLNFYKPHFLHIHNGNNDSSHL